MLLIKILKFKYLNTLLAITLILLLISIVVDGTKANYYNNFFKIKNQEILSEDSINMIAITVTGDKSFLTSKFENLYKDLHIIHLLVLSGSNLVIFNTFLSLVNRRDSYSHFVIVLISLITYYCYISYLHPVARAFIFMSVTEFITFKGFKSLSIIVIIIKIVVSFFAFFYFQFSNSFLLSFLFSLLIVLYNSVFVFKSKSATFLSSFIIFPIFITIFSIPIQLYFFNDYNLKLSLLSNILITTTYDYIVFICYLAYFAGFFDPLAYWFLPLVDIILKIFTSYIFYIQYLIKIYN